MIPVHMLKSRKGNEVTTRCGTTIKINSTKAIDGIGVTGWEKRVTCPGCVLPGRSPKSGMVMDQEALLDGTGRWGEGYPSVTHTPEWHEDPAHIYDPDTNPSGCDKFYCLSRFNPEGYPSVTEEP